MSLGGAGPDRRPPAAVEEARAARATSCELQIQAEAARTEALISRSRARRSCLRSIAVRHSVGRSRRSIHGPIYAMAAEDRGAGDAAIELRDVSERMRLFVDAVDEYAIYMLDPDGTVITWNHGAARLKGYTADEVIGRHFSAFYTPEDVAAGRPGRNLAEAMAKGRIHDEAWRLRKDGTRFWANVALTALFDDDGSLRGFAKITRDDTERMAADTNVRELELLNERERIAAELSHSIVERIFRAGMLLEGIRTIIRDPAAEQRLIEAIAHLDDTIKEIRTTISGYGDNPGR